MRLAWEFKAPVPTSGGESLLEGTAGLGASQPGIFVLLRCILVPSFVASFIVIVVFFLCVLMNRIIGLVHFKRCLFVVHVVQWWITVRPLRPTKGGVLQSYNRHVVFNDNLAVTNPIQDSSVVYSCHLLGSLQLP